MYREYKLRSEIFLERLTRIFLKKDLNLEKPHTIVCNDSYATLGWQSLLCRITCEIGARGTTYSYWLPGLGGSLNKSSGGETVCENLVELLEKYFSIRPVRLSTTEAPVEVDKSKTLQTTIDEANSSLSKSVLPFTIRLVVSTDHDETPPLVTEEFWLIDIAEEQEYKVTLRNSYWNVFLDEVKKIIGSYFFLKLGMDKLFIDF